MNGTVKHITSFNVEDVIRDLKESPVVGFDTETTSLHSKDGRLRLIQLSTKETTYIFDCFKYDPLLLAPVFDGSVLLVGHNIVFELTFLWSVGITLPNGKNIFDTMIGAQILEAGLGPFKKGHFSLEEVVLRYLGMVMDKTLQTSNWSGSLSNDQLIYAAKDAMVCIYLYEKMMQEIVGANLKRTSDLEMRCLPGMAWLNKSGMPVDKNKWHKLADKYTKVCENFEYTLAEFTDTQDLFGWSRVNWNSQQQILVQFAKQGIVIPDTTNYTLGQLAADGNELAQMLQDYREKVKRRDTYGHQWADQHIWTDGRVYANWHQVEARTGRQSCSDPNLQNIPRDKEFRSCFVPSEGYLFTIGDYSQIELRIAVEMTQDRAGIQAYCIDKTDLHRATAQLILGSISDEARQIAKSLNFGLIFGAGAETMRLYAQSAFNVHMTIEEAIERRNKWRAIYKEIVAWHKATGADMKIHPVVETRTVCGRRRLNVDQYTIRLNTPVQGTAGDGLKGGIALCYETRNEVSDRVKPVGFIHDEIIFETPEEEAPSVREWQQRNMELGMRSFVRRIPVVAEVKETTSWADK